MMKKIALILILLLVVTTKAFAYFSDAANDEMIDLAEIVMDAEMTIEQWQVTLKEQVSQKRVQSMIKKLEDSHLASIKEDKNSIKYSFSDTHKTGELIEQFNVIVPKSAEYAAEIIAVIKGNYWDSSMKKNYKESLKSLPEYLFTQNVKKYACLTTTSSDTISNNYFVRELKQKLDLQHIMAQNDTVGNSVHEKFIYGYTPRWDQKITSLDNPLNLQIALRDNGNDRTKLTIGTPILITEY